MPNNDSTEFVGIHQVGLHAARLDLIFRQQPEPDHGVDAEFELRKEGRATGRLVAVQIKAGSSYFSEEAGGGFVFRMNQQHFSYWTNHSLPMIVVLCDTVHEACYWEHVTSDNCISTGEGYKIVVPRTQVLDLTALPKIEEIASPIAAASDYTIVSEKDFSHAGARRVSLNAVVHAQHAALNKPKIAAIARALFQHGQNSKYARDTISEEAHLGREPDIVWGFLYLREADIASANWVCRFEWINPRLPQNMRPIEQRGEQVGGGLKIEWRSDQVAISQFVDNATLNKSDYLKAADLCIERAHELLIELITINSGDHTSIQTFCSVAETFDRWWSSVELAPYECARLDEVLTRIASNLGNAGLVWSDTFDRPPAQKLHLAKKNEEAVADALSYSSFLRLDIR